MTGNVRMRISVCLCGFFLLVFLVSFFLQDAILSRTSIFFLYSLSIRLLYSMYSALGRIVVRLIERERYLARLPLATTATPGGPSFI